MAGDLNIYTDGACLGNPGPGGWGAVILDGSQKRVLHGSEFQTTNNRMELTATIKSLEYCEKIIKKRSFIGNKSIGC